MTIEKSVAHIVIPYIRPTETFIYDRITNHHSYRPCVMTDEQPINLSQFPFDDIRTLSTRPLIERKLDAVAKRSFSASPFFTRALKKEKPAAAHAHYGPVGAAAALSCSSAGVPLMVSFYGVDASAFLSLKRFKRPYSELFKIASAISVLSEDMKTRLCEAGCPVEKIDVHHLAVDTTALTPSPAVKKETADIVSVGRLVPKKGMLLLVEAFSKIKATRREARLHIYGEGPMEKQLGGFIAEKKLSDKVFLHGGKPRPVVLGAIREADVFALFSITAPDGDMEGTPTVLIEAGALGIPSVSTLHAGIPEVVLNEKTGLLCREKDTDAFAHHLSRLIDNEDLRSNMGAAARSHITEHFDIRNVMLKIEKCYDEISG